MQAWELLPELLWSWSLWWSQRQGMSLSWRSHSVVTDEGNKQMEEQEKKRLNWTKGLDWNLKNASFISPCFTLNNSLISLIWHWLTSNKTSFLLAWFPSAWHLSPCTPAGAWQSRTGPLVPALPAWVAAAVWPSALLQLRQSTDATHLFHPWLLRGMGFLLFSLQVSILILFFPLWASQVEFCSARSGPGGFSGFLVFQSYSGSVVGCSSCLPAFLWCLWKADL